MNNLTISHLDLDHVTGGRCGQPTTKLPELPKLPAFPKFPAFPAFPKFPAFPSMPAPSRPVHGCFTSTRR